MAPLADCEVNIVPFEQSDLDGGFMPTGQCFLSPSVSTLQPLETVGPAPMTASRTPTLTWTSGWNATSTQPSIIGSLSTGAVAVTGGSRSSSSYEVSIETVGITRTHTRTVTKTFAIHTSSTSAESPVETVTVAIPASTVTQTVTVHRSHSNFEGGASYSPEITSSLSWSESPLTPMATATSTECEYCNEGLTTMISAHHHHGHPKSTVIVTVTHLYTLSDSTSAIGSYSYSLHNSFSSHSNSPLLSTTEALTHPHHSVLAHGHHSTADDASYSFYTSTYIVTEVINSQISTVTIVEVLPCPTASLSETESIASSSIS